LETNETRPRIKARNIALDAVYVIAIFRRRILAGYMRYVNSFTAKPNPTDTANSSILGRI
jgi:hypothetical protein